MTGQSVSCSERSSPPTSIKAWPVDPPVWYCCGRGPPTTYSSALWSVHPPLSAFDVSSFKPPSGPQPCTAYFQRFACPGLGWSKPGRSLQVLQTCSLFLCRVQTPSEEKPFVFGCICFEVTLSKTEHSWLQAMFLELFLNSWTASSHHSIHVHPIIIQTRVLLRLLLFFLWKVPVSDLPHHHISIWLNHHYRHFMLI